MKYKNIFLFNDYIQENKQLFSFYNLSSTKYINNIESVKYIKDVSQGKNIIAYNPNENQLNLLSMFDNKKYLIFSYIDKYIFKIIKSQMNNYKILIFTSGDKSLMEQEKELNYEFINPLINIDNKNENYYYDLPEMSYISCYSNIKNITKEDEFTKDIINLEKNGIRFVFKGPKEIENEKEYELLKNIIFNNLEVLAYPLHSLKEELITEKFIFSICDRKYDFPIEILYYIMANKKMGCIYYKGYRKFDWLLREYSNINSSISTYLDKSKTKDVFAAQKKAVLNFYKDAKNIEEVINEDSDIKLEL